MKKLNDGGDWEKEWADAFEHASLQPSDNVWNAIDGDLANKELRKYKKRAAFFQWVAAASVFLSVCGVAWQLTQPGGAEADRQMTEQQQQQEVRQPVTDSIPLFAGEEASSNEKASEKAALAFSAESQAQTQVADAPVAENSTGVVASQGRGEKANAGTNTNKTGSTSGTQPAFVPPAGAYTAANQIAQPGNNPGEAAFQGSVAENGPADAPGLYDAEKAGFIFFEQARTAVEADFQKVWLASDLFPKKEEASDARFWLGATLTSSSFNPNFQENSSSLATMAAREFEPVKGGLRSTARVSQWNEEAQPQISINGGVQAAARLGKKWVLQGGIQYGSYRSETTAGTYVDQNGAQAYPLHYANFSQDRVQLARAGSRLTAPVDAMNTFEFISVPLQLGYVLIDRKFSLLVSPGVSSEFFLRNQLSDQDNRLSTYTIYSGEEAPFETVHFKALLGAQLFYKLSDNYMISLEPSFQQALTNFNKSSSLFESRPSSVGVSAGFRYLIR